MKNLALLCVLIGALSAGNAPEAEISGTVSEAVVETGSVVQRIDDESLLNITSDEGLTVVSSGVYLETREDGDALSQCVVYAEIRNDTDHTVYLNGFLHLLEGESRTTELRDELTRFTPLKIEPGQTAYFNNGWAGMIGYRQVSLRSLSEIRLSFTDGPVNEQEVSWWGEPVRVIYQDDSVTIEPTAPPDWATGPDALRVTFINRTGDLLPNPAAAVAAYDAEGRLLYVAGSSVVAGNTDHVCYVPDGSPCAIVLCINEAVSQYMAENAVKVSEYRTVIYGGDMGGAL